MRDFNEAVYAATKRYFGDNGGTLPVQLNEAVYQSLKSYLLSNSQLVSSYHHINELIVQAAEYYIANGGSGGTVDPVEFIEISSPTPIAEGEAAGFEIANVAVTAPGSWLLSFADDDGGRVAFAGNTIVTTSTPFVYATDPTPTILIKATRVSDGFVLENPLTLLVYESGTLITSFSELSAALVGSPGTVGGVTLILDATSSDFSTQPSGVYTITAQPPTTLTIRGSIVGTPYSTEMPKINRLILDGCKNIVIEYLDIGDPTDQVNNRIYAVNRPENVTVQYCNIYGKFLDKAADYSTDVNQPTSRALGSTGSGAGGGVKAFKFNHNYVHDLGQGAAPSNWRGTGCECSYNDLERIYTDALKISMDTEDLPHGLKKNFNRLRYRVCLSTDFGNPHGDGTQWQIGNAAPGDFIRDVECIGNITWDPPDARGAFSMDLYTDVTGNLRPVNWKFHSNVHVSWMGDNHMNDIRNISGCYLVNNTGAYHNPPTTSPSIETFNCNWPGLVGGQPNYIDGCIASSFGISGPVQSGSTNTSLFNTLISHQNNFVGPTYNPTTWEELISAYRTKESSPRVVYAGMVNYSSRVINIANERSWVGFEDVSEAAISTLQTTGWRKLIGGGPSQTATIASGFEWREADNASGTTPGLWVSSGTVSEGKFYQLRFTTGASGNITTDAAFTINGWVNTWTISTAVVNLTADNGGAAYTKISGSMASESNRTKAVILIRSKFDTATSSTSLYANGTSGTNQEFGIDTGGTLRLRFGTSGVISAVSNSVADTNVHTDMILIDLSKTTQPEVLRWWHDGTLLTSFSGTIATTGTSVFNPSTIFTDFNLFARDVGGRLSDSRISHLLFDWGDNTYTFPDMSDPVAMNMIASSQDAIGNGTGFLGHQAKALWYGPVGASDGSTSNSWNATAGLSNRGTNTTPLIKVTGTFTDV